MKKRIGLAVAVCSLMTATPVAAMAAEFPAVDVATVCTFHNNIYGYKDETGVNITMEKMNLWETETDAFESGAEFIFHAEDTMDFAARETFVVEEGSLKAECSVKDGSLLVKILNTDAEQREVLKLSDLELFCDAYSVEDGAYDLYADYHSAIGNVKNVKIAEDFVKATDYHLAIKNWQIVVPVGEKYLISDGETMEMDTPAYLSKAGYTMLPVRAVANAFGMHPKNVHWDAESKTVTLLYGEKIIQMVVGEKKININGTEKATSAAVEIVNGRTFLPMRDLGNALGAEHITWDAATKTAVLSSSFLERGGR